MSSRAKIRTQPYFSSYLNRRITRSSGSVCSAMASMRSMLAPSSATRAEPVEALVFADLLRADGAGVLD